MSFNAAALRMMADKGLSSHDIAEIAAANEGGADSAAEKRRAWDRERKREKREAALASTGHSTGNPPDPSPNERDNLTPTRNPPIEPRGSKPPRNFPAPPQVSDEQWTDFLTSPKRRKAGMSATAYSGVTKNLKILAEHGFPPGEMIALAVERGWTTVKLQWVLNDNDRRTNGMGRHQSSDGLSSTARAAIAVFGPPEAGDERRVPQ